MQGDAQVALMEQLMATEARQYFLHTFDGRPMKDSELGLPPGTLGREMARATGRRAEDFAEVPQLVSLLTFHEGTVATTVAERIAQREHLTDLARIAAASPATRVLSLHGADLTLTPAEFLELSVERPDQPGSELMVWVSLVNHGNALSTLGLSALGLPEARLSLGAQATVEEVTDRANVLLTLGMLMMRQNERVADGSRIGTWETRFDGHEMHVRPVEQAPWWRRLFR